MNKLLRYGVKKGAPTLLRRAANWVMGVKPEELERYRQYIKNAEPDARALDDQRRRVFADMPRVSVICPLCNPKKKYITDIITSLQAQTYSNWELLFPDTSRGRDREYNKYLLEGYDKVRHIPQRTNYGFARSAHEAVAAATGECLIFMEQDGLFSPSALFSLVEAFYETRSDFIYADEDIISGSERRDPLFKPNWSPDMLDSLPYTGRPTLYSLELYKKAGGLLENAEGLHEYDLAIRASKVSRGIVHVPRVLYHNRDEVSEADNESFMRTHTSAAQADAGLYAGSRRLRFPIRARPLVTVAIRYLGDESALEGCLGALHERTTYDNLEILVYMPADAKLNPALAERMKKEGVRVEGFGAPFNATGAVNALVRSSAGEYVLLLDSDVEPVSPEWIESMLEHAQRPEIGAVGAKLVSPSGKVRHAGVVIGLNGTDGSVCRGCDDANDAGALINLYLNTVRNVSAVTGACLMVKRQVFMDAGMLDESFIKIGSDVEFCLRLMRKGLRNIYTPFAKLRQSGPEGEETPRGDTVRSYDAYRSILKHGDPYYNINLDYSSAIPRVAENMGLQMSMNPVMSN